MTVKIIYIFKKIPSCKRILFGGCMANTINLGGNEKRNKITDVNMTNNKETATSLIFFRRERCMCYPTNPSEVMYPGGTISL